MMDKDSAISLEGRLGKPVWNVPAMLKQRAQLSGSAPASWSLSASGSWQPTTWAEYRDIVARLARGLCKLGLSTGDRVAIMVPSSREWDFLQVGILAARGVVVGLDSHDRDDNLNAVAKHCGLAGLVVREPSDLERFDAQVRDRLRFVVSLKPTAEQGLTAFADLFGAEDDPAPVDLPGAQPDDTATVIFTSGTTGGPKGIEYTHRQLCLAVASILDTFPDVGSESRVACWLPLSNLFQRIIDIGAIACGAQLYYVEDPRSIMKHVGSIEPDLFIGVPRFYEKLHAGIMDKVSQGPALQRSLVAWALRAGEQHASQEWALAGPAAWQRWQHMLADRLVLRRLRGVLGSRLRFLISGSAPMPAWLLGRFQAMGLPILEAYGLSENVVPVAMNRPDAYRFGSVGLPLPGNELRLADDGELWVRGPGVFRGYLGGAGEEARFDADGFLATGDYAAIDSAGFVTLTGRKSEVFKTSTGRRVAPAPIESALRQVAYVEHAVLFGAGRPFTVALLSVSTEAWHALNENDNGCSGLESRCDSLRRAVVPCLSEIADYQRPAGLVVATHGFTINGGELTSNLKVRRGEIEDRFGDSLDALYLMVQSADGTRVQTELDDGQVILCSL